MKRRINIAVGMLVVAAGVTVSSPDAIARVTDEPTSTQVGIQGIGQQTWILPHYTQVDMKPIPGTDAPNTGLARPGDNIAAICALPDSRGVEWMLGLNRNGRAGEQAANTVGFIPLSTVYPVPSLSWCNLQFANRVTIVSDLFQVDMKPIPGTDAPNTGLAQTHDRLALVCSLWDNRNLNWILVINVDGRAGQQYPDTVGFVPAWTLRLNGSVASCGAT